MLLVSLSPTHLPRSLQHALAATPSSSASRRALAGRLRELSAARLAVLLLLGGPATASCPVIGEAPERRPETIAA